MISRRSLLGRLVLRIIAIFVVVALTVAVTYGLASLGVTTRYLPFVAAVALCCFIDGFSGGVLAALLSAASIWYFLLPPVGFAVPDFSDTCVLFLFIGVTLFLCWIISRLRRSNTELMQENFELGYKVVLMRELRARLNGRRADLRPS